MDSVAFEFHIAREARDRYGFADLLFSVTGNVIIADLAASRDLAHRMNAVRDATHHPQLTVNPGALNAMGLFDDEALAAATAYKELSGALRDYFDTRPRFGPENQNLIDMLRAPALASPDSLEGQLEYVRHHWADLLGDLLDRLLLAMDVLKEEQVALWLRFHPPGQGIGAAGAGLEPAAYVPSYSGQDPEDERFSRDAEWMARTVLIAKNTFVWLDQLSRAYGRAITRLDQIPDEALATLARRGFNALWLIGLWERSRASQRIKQLCGNPEAVASAYSLYDYRIASDLGGGTAYDHFRARAGAHGIRLASDMVPNHMGIDSRWVVEHPERFLALPTSPFPAYRFDGPNLSDDDRVEIKIEDHYYDRSDAGVVFRRVARHPAAGRGLLAHGRLLRADARHAPRLQQRVHGHAARRGQRQVPPGHQEHPGVRPRHPQALRQLHEQPRRAHRRRPVRERRQVLRRVHADGDDARAADVRPRPGRGLHRALRHGVPPRVLRRAAGRPAGRRARAPDRAAATPPPAVRRGPGLPALRFLHRRGLGQRGRVRVLQPARRRPGADRLSQPVCAHAGLGPPVVRVGGQGRRPPPRPDVAGRGARRHARRRRVPGLSRSRDRARAHSPLTQPGRLGPAPGARGLHLPRVPRLAGGRGRRGAPDGRAGGRR